MIATRVSGLGASAVPGFGGTVAAPIWARFMKAALANVPPADFIPPDQKLWPRAQQIDEQGRGYHSYFYYSPTTTTLPAAAVPTTTAPHGVTPTTSPFAPPPTVPRTTPPPPPPPATTPPTTPTSGP